MKLIVGLGNPGKKYQTTRHNTGFLFLDMLRETFLFQKGYRVTEWEEEKTFMSELSFLKKGSQVVAIFQKPLTFMNNSGQAVGKIVKKYDIDVKKDLILVHDDLDLPLGKYKLQYEKSPDGHNGVIDVENILKTKEFLRLRLGIESRAGKEIPGDAFVLMNFSEDEQLLLDEVFQDALKSILGEILL
ncbi:MAG: aminoacyl-tRNA hydrolase [Candidatus Dojkabacteria bacterium]|jgi:PTH1 family peptidyl-tRNA hydrolase